MVEGENVSLLNNDAGYLTSFTESDPVWTAAEPDYGNLTEAEEITGNWVNTANPWSTDEIVSTVMVEGENVSLLNNDAGYASKINELSDAKTDGTSVFLGSGAGGNDDGNNYNMAVGINALLFNTTGSHNTASGYHSLNRNTTGNYNTASGTYSLLFNKTGSHNTASGYYSLPNNTTGSHNTAIGNFSLYSNTTGSHNTASGYYSLRHNTTGHDNTAIGDFSLYSNTTGNYNTALGESAFSSGTDYNNSTGLGYDAEPGASNTIMLGNSSVTWIGGHSTWHNTSDARVKKNVQEDVVGLDFIMDLRPVTYYFDKDKMDELTGTVDSSDYAEKYDVENIKQSGFLAQEVEAAANSAGYDFSGVSKPSGDVKYYSLAYAEFVVPLVKAVQEQQETIQQQQEKIDALTKQNAEILKRLEALEGK